MRLSFFFALALLCSTAQAFPSIDYSLSGEDVLVDGPDGIEHFPIGCTGLSSLVYRDKLYVACGTSGVVVLSLDDPFQPVVELRSKARKDEEALELFVRNNQVWVRVRALAERPVFQQPAQSGQTRFSHLGVAGESCRTDSDCQGHLVCIGGQCSSSAHTRAEEPPPAQSEPWADWVAPPRRGNLLSLFAGTTGWVPVSPIGISVAFDVDATYRFAFPLTVHLKLAPLGFTWANGGNIFGTSFAGIVSIDTNWFELGLGPGAMSLNNDEGPKGVFLLAPFVRVGSIDGIGVWLQGDVAIIDRMPQAGWQAAGLSGELQIPVADRSQLRFRGGGSIAGWGRAEGGLRYRLVGDGGHHSVFLSGWLGLGVSFFTPSAATYSGPALGAGVEWRP